MGFGIWDSDSHCQEHEHNDGGSDDQDFVRDEEGDVGDEDEEEGGGEGGDDGALHPPHQVDLEFKAGVGAHAILSVLSKFFNQGGCDSKRYHVNKELVAGQADLLVHVL